MPFADFKIFAFRFFGLPYSSIHCSNVRLLILGLARSGPASQRLRRQRSKSTGRRGRDSPAPR